MQQTAPEVLKLSIPGPASQSKPTSVVVLLRTDKGLPNKVKAWEICLYAETVLG